jgi:Cof subfamily protein (haloacid dehalogenase superfamily)
MAVRIFASDLDGTLFDDRSRVSDETVRAVHKAQSAGAHFIITTGREWRSASPIIKAAGIEADYVLLNGAEFRASDGRLIYQEALDPARAQQVMEYLSQSGLDFVVNTDKGDFTTNRQLIPDHEAWDAEEIRKRGATILKFFAFSSDKELLQKARLHLSKWRDIALTSSAAWNVEVTSSAAKKGDMLERAAAYYRASKDEVMVFGNGMNDESMFLTFPHSRAVGNAEQEILALAEKVIESNEENGVAKEILRHL